MMRKLIVCLALTGVVVAASIAYAQRGDRGSQEQPEVWKEMDVPPAPPLAPDEAIKSFRIMPGFRVELVAAEPLVEDPVAMDWDAAGRLYVVEMRGYMPNVDGTGEDAPIGRVVRLEDTDGDGRMDRSVVFLDKLVMPRAVAVLGDGGVLVGEPPHLWLCRDTDGDGVSDEKTEIYGNYGRQGPVEHTDNGLLQAIDNWVYNAKSDKRFRIEGGKLTVEPTRFRGQWGIAQDNFGRLYYNSNSDYLRVDLLPSDLLDRNPHYAASAGLGVSAVTDQSVWSIRVNPGVNRGYQKGTLHEDGRLRRTTAVSGVAIYRGDQFGDEYIGDAFVPEPSANVVACFDIEDGAGGGLSMKSTQRTTPDERWGKRAFLASTDERFRPVSVYNGPDGAMYVVDMYRGILQHKTYVTTYLRKQILERGLDKPVGMGRIYRIVREDRPIERTTGDLSKLSSVELVAKLGDAKGWTRDMAQRLLVARRDAEAVEPLRKVIAESDDAMARIHALWTLRGMDELRPVDAMDAAARSQSSPQALVAAIRCGVQAMVEGWTDPHGFARGPGPIFTAAKAEDSFVRAHGLHAAAWVAMRDLPDSAVAWRLLMQTAARRADEPTVRDALLIGLAGREVDAIQAIEWEWDATVKPTGGSTALLRDAAVTVMRRGDADQIATLIDRAAAMERPWAQVAVLTGMTSWNKTPRKLHLAERTAAIDALLKSPDKKVAELAAKLDTQWLAYGEAVGDTGPRKLTDAEQKLYDLGKERYALICAACHQPHGKGQAGLAPPLAESDWVTGDPAVAARIVLHGMMGPIEVNGQMWELVMPGNAANPLFDDAAIAGVLTYIRREWGNEAEPVGVDLVNRIRETDKERVEPWTVQQLREAHPEARDPLQSPPPPAR